MILITAKLFGNPRVLKNDEDIIFPYKKAEALFYYLLLEKRASRETLVNLFWGDVSEEIAKKNLRNAVYMIRKIFNEDVLISPQRSIITLNPDIQFKIDVDEFNWHKDDNSLFNYTGELLEGFLIKDAEAFEEWMYTLRDKHKDIYINKIYLEIEKAFKNNNFNKTEEYCKQLISIDEFDERAYRRLMKTYRAQGKFNQGIDIYNRLLKLLKKELSITPDKKTTEVYDAIIKEKLQREAINKKEDEFFYGRNRELLFLEENYESFISNGEAQSMLLIGEAGIGKSKLLEYFIKTKNDNKNIFMTVNCYQAEENYFLKPWNEIFSQIAAIIKEESIPISKGLNKIVGHIFPSFSSYTTDSSINIEEDLYNLKCQVLENALIEILERVSKDKKLFLVFEDIQWADTMTITLLKNLIFKNKNNTILVLATSRNEHRKDTEAFMLQLGRHNLLKKLMIERFKKQETIEFAKKLLPNYQFNRGLQETIYSETEGNAFFLMEFLNNLKNNKSTHITSNMEDILKGRFVNISEEAKKLLNIISVYFDSVQLEDLQKLSGKNDLEIIDIIDELKNKNILKESKGSQDVELAFTHQKLREYLYMQLSLSRRKLLHQKIGNLLEGKLKKDKRDIFLYSKLIHHFYNGGNWIAALKYNIKNLEEYLDFNHEIFPVINTMSGKIEDLLYLSKEQVKKKLKEIHQLIDKVIVINGYGEEVSKIQITYFLMTGRFLIIQGDYDEGIKNIKKVISRSIESKEYALALKGYRQMIYYCINTQNIVLMEELIENALLIAKESDEKEETAILYRLKGALKIMQGLYSEGEAILKESINIFNTLPYPEKYLLHIAAIYNYIGESKRHSQNFKEAIDYYKRAISICNDKKILRGLAIFHTNAGLACYADKDYVNAKLYFNRALKIYKEIDYLWGRSMAYGHLALLLIKEERYEEGLKSLMKAEADSQKLKSPYEIALVLRVKGEIAKEMDKNKALRGIFAPYIEKSHEHYCNEGIAILKELRGYYEVNLLNQLKKQ
ncbi:tetratricopeptide repeat protein [Alkaliphilus pronyensis]|uniref:Tetratricopeptide repeat protein n=1 Tax=Alkaliphilus pronyensis TaxID=1482732 RepID=A0A6I0F524_9FIRM|nr:tetratricopeptide repeat protein [Alkaliphilus pronyensis]KAB3534809.1 tetratricopeptide repeat protein [Alkaliphilus pronyensis]